MTTYDDTEAEARSGPVIWLLYVNAVAWPAVGVILAVVVLDQDRFQGRGASGAIFQGFLGLFLLLIVTGVLWLRWFKVIAQRTERTGRARLRGSWWLWAWLLPGAYLVLPKMMVNDAWQAPDPPGRPEPLPAAIQWWWGLWVATGASGYLLRTLAAFGEWFGALWMIAFFVSQAAQALLAVRLVRALTAKNALLGARPQRHPGYVPPSWPAPTPS